MSAFAFRGRYNFPRYFFTPLPLSRAKNKMMNDEEKLEGEKV
jgi:hypothetical protein